MEDVICFLHYSLKLTTLVRWYLSLAIVLVMVDVWNASPCTSNQDRTLTAVCGRIFTLKNFVIVSKQYLNRRMHLVISNVHVVTGSNSTIQSNYRTSRIPRYCCPNLHRSPSMSHNWNRAFRIVAFLWRSPNIIPDWCWGPYCVFTDVRRPGFVTITSSFSPFGVVQ